MIIGLYGRIGSGKSTMCNYLRTKGFRVIDCDKISRDIMMPGKPGLCRVKEVFGDSYLKSDGTLNRKRLGDYVFSAPRALKQLNEITHPLIIVEVMRQLKKYEGHDAVIEGAVLYTTGIIALCDTTVVVKSDATLKRIMERDYLSEEEATRRINAQEIYEKADFILENNTTVSEFYHKIDEMLQTIAEQTK